MDKYYIGYDERGNGEIFACDNPKYATPEESGYCSVSEAFDTKEEAEANLQE